MDCINFSNEGETTWYGFAEEILKISGNLDKIQLNKDNSYKTIAERPEYSVLSKQKLKDDLNYTPKAWEESLSELYATYQKA